MKHPQLTGDARTIFGKKLKKIRREGLLPGNVYGKGLNSYPLQIKLSDFQAVYKEAGETGLVDLSFDGKMKPVLIKNLQMDHVTRTPLHVDFYQVNLKEKVKATVAVVLTGEAKAVTDKVGLLIQNLSDVEVEALPDKLPENVELSVEHLAEIGEQVTVGDIKAPADVTILTDAGQTVAKIVEPVVEEPEPEEAAEGEEGAEGEAAEGEATEGEESNESGDNASRNESSDNPQEEKKEE
ncbi:MAG TPA: 50S ribosomal protein L25 [Candidatus Saccharimonadales bacterium]|nr:50S ribosomal protein L25 [Candidatus Saccharimonadales bacterium]